MKVFISYSHDSARHKDQIYKLAQRLKSDGVGVILDRDMLPGGPSEGWPAWSEKQVIDAELVLVACTQTYARRYEGKETPGSGLGSVCEARTIQQELYNSGGINQKFRVILFDDKDNDHVPSNLQSYHRFQLNQADNYTQLLGWVKPSFRSSSSPTQVQSLDISWPSIREVYPWKIADRKDIFKRFQKIIMGEISQRILLLCGATNTGKSTLLNELSAYAQHLQVRSTRLDFKGCPSLEELFETLRLDLEQEILPTAYTAVGTARYFNLISDFKQLRTPVLLIFDKYEEASLETQTWLESQLLPRMDQAPAVVTIIGGQKTPEHDKHPWRGLAEAYNLSSIERVEDWMEFCRQKWHCPNLDHAHVQALTIAAQGDPGMVSALLETLVQGLQPKITP